MPLDIELEIFAVSSLNASSVYPPLKRWKKLVNHTGLNILRNGKVPWKLTGFPLLGNFSLFSLSYFIKIETEPHCLSH